MFVRMWCIYVAMNFIACIMYICMSIYMADSNMYVVCNACMYVYVHIYIYLCLVNMHV